MIRMLLALSFIPLSLHAHEKKNFDIADLEGEGAFIQDSIYNKTVINFRARVREYKNGMAPEAPAGISLTVSDGHNQFTVVTQEGGKIEWNEYHRLEKSLDLSALKPFTFPRYIVAHAPLKGIEHHEIGIGFKNGKFMVFQETEEPHPFQVKERLRSFYFDDFIPD